jgi:signal transduction histidine kinase
MLKNWYVARMDRSDGEELSAAVQLDRQVIEVLVGVRICMTAFVLLSVIGSYGKLSQPSLVLLGLAAIVAQCALLVRSIGRVDHLRMRLYTLFDLAGTGIILVLFVFGAGSSGRHAALNGLLPYLLAQAGLLGSRLRGSWTGLASLAALVVAWVFVPLGHTLPAELSDLFGLVFWYVIGSLVTIVLVRLAQRVDDEREQAVIAERNEVERWLHDDLINIVGRVARAEPLTDADRSRAGRLEVRARLRIADVRVIAPSIEGLLDAAALAAETAGLTLLTDTSVTGDPHRPDVMRAVSLALSCLIGNAGRHASCDRVRVAVLADAGRLVVTLADRGSGYDPSSVNWSPNTKRMVFDAMAQLGGSAIPQPPLDGVGSQWRLQWPT